jgi:putative ABC transport system permease protein
MEAEIHMSSLVQDIRFALRQTRSRPGFTMVVIGVLALGLGANAAIFSVVNAALLRRLPYPEPSRLVLLFERGVVREGGGPNVVSLRNFLDWRSKSTSFQSMAAGRGFTFNLGADRNFRPERIQAAVFTSGLFQTLGVQPMIGRGFRAEEDRWGAPRVVVISYGMWQSRFAEARDILQRTIRLDDLTYQIVGVMPRNFSYPRRDVQLWVPLQQLFPLQMAEDRTIHEFYVVARLRHGATLATAQNELDALQRRIWESNGKGLFGHGAFVFLLSDVTVREFKTNLYLLFGAVGCVLLVACVNIANLLLARGSQRAREVAIRAALGAGRGRLLRQLLTESVLLSAAGAAIGLVLASYLTNFFAERGPTLLNLREDFEPANAIQLDGWVFAFTAAIAIATGIATGIVPALRAARINLAERLKDGSRSSTAGRGQNRFRYGLIAAEVALSLVLLISAGLLLRSFLALRGVNSGVRADHVLTASLSLPDVRYGKREQVANFTRNLIEKLRSVPGVKSAAIVSCLPVGGYCGDSSFDVEGHPLPPGQFTLALNRAASPNYFATAGIPILRGRALTEHDGVGFDNQHPRTGAMVISESMAHEFFPNEDPIGKRIYFGDAKSPRYEVVGISSDVLISLADKPRPTMYRPIFDGDWTDFYAFVRTETEPGSLASAVAAEVNRLDPNLAVTEVRTMDDVLGSSSAHRQFTAFLIGCFAGIALILAAVGLYGVLYYVVGQRTNEIGIRVTLGATASEVRRLVLWQGMQPVFLGTALGLAAAVAVTRYFESLLFGVHAGDPATFVFVTALLLGVVFLACCIPAVRATRIDPAIALRVE